MEGQSQLFISHAPQSKAVLSLGVESKNLGSPEAGGAGWWAGLLDGAVAGGCLSWRLPLGSSDWV